MKTIWKWVLPVPDATGRIDLALPAYADILGVGVQGSEIVLWGIVDQNAKSQRLVPHVFYALNTGMHFDLGRWNRFEHVGTVMVGSTVWHVFEAA